MMSECALLNTHSINTARRFTSCDESKELKELPHHKDKSHNSLKNYFSGKTMRQKSDDIIKLLVSLQQKINKYTITGSCLSSRDVQGVKYNSFVSYYIH